MFYLTGHNGAMKFTVRRMVVIALCIGLLLLAVPIFMRISVQHYMYSSIDTVPQAQVALVLGASVIHGVPSPILS